MIAFILQLAACLAISAGGFVLLGTKVYVVVALASAITAAGCLLAVPGKFEDTDRIPLVDVLTTLVIGLFLGAMWVALPIVVAIGAARNRASHSDSARPSPPPDACSDHRRSGEA